MQQFVYSCITGIAILDLTKENSMTKLISTLRTALANRRAYNRAILDIEHLDTRELNDMNVDRETLIAGAYRQVYGATR